MRSLCRHTIILLVIMLVCTSISTVYAKILYQQDFANRIDYVSFPFRGWVAYDGPELNELTAGQGGVEPATSLNEVDRGFAEFNQCKSPLILWTDRITNGVPIESISKVTWHQSNDADWAWHLLIQVEERNDGAWYYSVQPFSNDELGRWEKKVLPISTDVSNWYRVEGIEKPGNSRVHLTKNHPSYPVRGILQAIGFLSKDPALSGRLDTVVLHCPDDEESFELSTTMLVVLIGIAAFVIFSIFITVYDKDPIKHPSSPGHH